MTETVFTIPKMDCPSEIQLIRMRLDGNPSIQHLDFDLGRRELKVLHNGESTELLRLLEPLNFGTKIKGERLASLESKSAEENDSSAAEQSALRKVFAINAAMFVAELVAGIIAQSTGLLADSLDMFADAAVFALSLYAVGRALSFKQRAARLSGYLQMALALGAFAEVIRNFVSGSEPEGPIMMVVAAVALIANAACMKILARHRKGEIHMQASWIFLTNDVIANGAVILAGMLVLVTGSHLPDLITGAIISCIVFAGAMKIMRASKGS